MSRCFPTRSALAVLALLCGSAAPTFAQSPRTNKPILHGRHWVAVTGKPLAASAGALTFAKGGNAIDAACAMLAATCTMWDTLGWGGETQALIYHPKTGRVIGVNALGVAPTGATVEFYRQKGMDFPPEYGPLAAVTPGTPGGLMVMLAEFGTLSLAEVLAPAIEMADGYPIEAQAADTMERFRTQISAWPDSRRVFLPHLDPKDASRRAAPQPGDIFRQPELAATLRRLVEAERAALAAGRDRKSAIMAAYDRFYRGDIAQELVASVRTQGGLFTLRDLDTWRVQLEEPVSTTYKGVEVYKLTTWTQGPAMLQALNLLEPFDLRAMGYNSARYIHTVYQAMNLAFADRDFYYGDPAFPPAEPIRGLLSKDYAKARLPLLNLERNDPRARPGDPYPFQGETNPYSALLEKWTPTPARSAQRPAGFQVSALTPDEVFRIGTTSIQAADASGWVISVTPSGGWIPAVIAGRTGIGLSQRMQSFVFEPAMNPFNVLEPGKRPRVTLTPSLALKQGKPFLAFSVQGGDSQDQNLLQFFLNVVEFDMDVQQAAEAANFASYQMQSSFGDHRSEPGRLEVRQDVPEWVRTQLTRMGYKVETLPRVYAPTTAIRIDSARGTFQGAASDTGEDYGIAW
ncbi:gamma-glutamyltransferase [Opitutus sp. ER46]|uniref:gamma-glutamyltransferase family protein n=1 Tax=Opitutus sp. ER46 TaxID=2161864 RepID=UPI000D304216|nr:gamma-glutamyltransferase [Opitutus sp. ER46]PTX94408.1 gamma-glutamyltransferase [Opitutus sp. ER46]